MHSATRALRWLLVMDASPGDDGRFRMWLCPLEGGAAGRPVAVRDLDELHQRLLARLEGGQGTKQPDEAG